MHMDPTSMPTNKRPSGLQISERSTTFQKFLAMQKLKKAALVVIASKLTQNEVGSLGDIFRRIDKEGDGLMTLTELDDAISRGKPICEQGSFEVPAGLVAKTSLLLNFLFIGQFPAEIQQNINTMKEELSLTGNDTLNWKAFLAATLDKNLVMREDKIRVAFDHFKHSDADHLTLSDFASIFEGEAQAKEIFDYLDNDRDGKVSFDDFRNALEECIDINQDYKD